MRFKSLLLITIFLIAPIILSGCDNSGNYYDKKTNFNNFARILNNFDESDIDMDYSIKANGIGISLSVNSKMIVKTIENKQVVYVKTGEGLDSVKMYYVDGYLYTEEDEKVVINTKTDFKVSAENPIPSEFNIGFLNDNFKKEEIDGKIVYTVSIPDADFKTYVEKIINDGIGGMRIDLTLEAKVDKETNQLETMKITMDITDSAHSLDVEICVTINTIGNQVELNVPLDVLQRIDQYQMLHPYPNREPINYEDTSLGVVKYYDLGTFRKIVFDKVTNQLIVLRESSIDLYDATSIKLNRSISSSLTQTNIDADNGKLVVGYNTKQFDIYDLSKENEPISISTDINVSEIIIDNDTVIYSSKEQRSPVTMYNLATHEENAVGDYYEPLLTLNRKDHILYVRETKISSNILAYINSQTGEYIYSTQFPQSDTVYNRVSFDGKFIHHEGQTFNRFTGSVHSSSYLNQSYPSTTGFTPGETIYDSEKVAFVRSTFTQNKIGIYDNINKIYVYQFPLYGGSIIELRDDNFLTISTDLKNVAVVDVKKINEGLKNDEPDEQTLDSVLTSHDGKLKTLWSTFYTDAIVDGNYIFVLSGSNNELRVYDVETLDIIYTERYLIKPFSIDAYAGKLVICFGDVNQFRIYNTTTWEYETVITEEPVYSAVIYNERIIYTGKENACDIREYSITTKTHTSFGYYGYFLKMAINREDGIIYFGDRIESKSSLAYFNLESNQKIFSLVSPNNNSILHFDGDFIHYANATYDKITGAIVTDNNMSRTYVNNNLNNVKTIFDNGEISIYTGEINGEIETVIYDIETSSEILTLKGKATQAYIVGEKIIIFSNSSKGIQILEIV